MWPSLSRASQAPRLLFTATTLIPESGNAPGHQGTPTSLPSRWMVLILVIPPNSMTMDPDPRYDFVVLSAQDSDRDLSFVPWNEGARISVNQLERDTGYTKKHPFLFLYD